MSATLEIQVEWAESKCYLGLVRLGTSGKLVDDQISKSRDPSLQNLGGRWGMGEWILKENDTFWTTSKSLSDTFHPSLRHPRPRDEYSKLGGWLVGWLGSLHNAESPRLHLAS